MEERRNVPKLRFPGFTDPWEQRRLGEVASFGGGHTPSMADLSNYENGSIPWVTSQDVKTQYLSRTKTLISDKGAAELNLYPAGSLVVVVRSGILRHTLPVAELRKPMTVNQDIRVIVPAESLSARWLLGYFEGHDKELLLKFGKVGTTVESINFSEMKSMALPMPSTTEQSRIGALFAKLDSLIALHQRELDHVKELKKGLLQKMFPKEGTNVPELRFPGFTDPWEQRRLGELGSVVMCKRIYKDQTTERGDVPFFKIGTFGGEPDAFISNELFEKYQELYSFPKVGDILISAAGTIGRTTVYQGERAYFQDSNIVWLDHDDRLDNGFLLQYLNDQTWSSLEGSTLKRLYNKDILDARIALPALDEQQCVGSFFAKLDSLIALHQRELDHVKELKKGLLQQMFV